MAATTTNEPTYVSVPGYTSGFCEGRKSGMVDAVGDIMYNIGKYMVMDFENANVKTQMDSTASDMHKKCENLRDRLSGVYFE